MMPVCLSRHGAHNGCVSVACVCVCVCVCPGTVLMMSLCEVVHVYEFLPSRRKTELCHYYQRFYDAACTLGAYHPLLYEKNLVKRINQGTDRDIFTYGRVTLPGFSTLNCTLAPRKATSP